LPRQVLRTLSRPLQLHPAFIRAAAVSAAGAASTRCLLFVRHLPVAGRLSNYFASAALWRNAKAEPRVVARRPAGLPPCHTAGHMAVVAEGRTNKRPPAMNCSIKPNTSNAVGNSVRRHKSPAAALAIIKALWLL